MHSLWITWGEELFALGQSGCPSAGHRGVQAQLSLASTAVSSAVPGGAVGTLGAVFTQLWELLVELFVHPVQIVPENQLRTTDRTVLTVTLSYP